MPDNAQPAPQKNEIFGAYKRKEYGWFIFYILFVVISARLGGAVGAAIGVLVIFALYRTLKNPVYSKTKKIFLSLVYLIGGVILIFLISALLLEGIYRMFGERAVASLSPEFQAAQSRTLSAAPFTSSTAPSLAEKPSATGLENAPYIDSRYAFSISYPMGWTTDTSKSTANQEYVEFDDPSNNEIALENITVEPAKGFDRQTFTKDVIAQFETTGAPYSNLQIVAQGNTMWDGQPAYEFEVTSDYTVNSQTYPFHGVYLVSVYSGTGYVFFAASLESIWAKYRDAFNSSASSFKF
jgi:uncharacterized MAPEG superfamily protein